MAAMWNSSDRQPDLMTREQNRPKGSNRRSTPPLWRWDAALPKWFKPAPQPAYSVKRVLSFATASE